MRENFRQSPNFLKTLTFQYFSHSKVYFTYVTIYNFIIITTSQYKRESLELLFHAQIQFLLLITVTLNKFTWKWTVTSLTTQDSYYYWNKIIIPFGDAITLFNNILQYGTIEEGLSRQLKKKKKADTYEHKKQVKNRN